ncbi:PhzF family phenazine biosynthesis protein [Brachyspira hyodysenteriae]|uniref:PhzF family phenazine biosynthesis protein n=1 Tax=Brachyspira hyodysenteriae TaxID=159 RepID=UPI00063DCA20|nr:PhzF family phenazine biosynthesis protein [Brachyspira hyodysenteriae]KLI23615.1 phenazine biosynthesis protein [Brachyspira hyodysenteriae]KLI25215.1 phenazine biosynthesis protein [Brachyspira hyodysenteriae]MCZ9893394.1 PhzF family phenazine biosynthesis protein [Brachyspira hyodysenteriae]MCZ9962791.1 PhzF family phenazine biosynthesis protein [Brachyspira hyodysenteriae]MCZ9990938.1 PhzF family phenazine biosynthesis protein [Brachyspira hyodysenteriae]
MENYSLKQYIVDAFTDKVFSGNPAAICLLDKWLSDDMMLNIAKENNLSETAFILKNYNDYELRWFTPGGEIDLCGHATLASAFVLMNIIDKKLKNISFKTKSGILNVVKNNDLYEMDFPSYELKKIDVTDEMKEAIGFKPLEAYMGRDLLCVLENEKQVIEANIDIEKVKNLQGLLLHITSKGSEYDCITRSFAPKLNVYEDPVCGSGHCHVVPLWSDKLGKKDIIAFQASKRGGVLYCSFNGNRVKLSGKAVLYSSAEIYIQ